MPAEVARGRELFARRAWAQAAAQFALAERAGGLGAADLEALAAAAYLAGDAEQSVQTWQRLYQTYCASGEVQRAARCAFWLAFILVNHGEPARGGGWVHRGARLLDQAALDCVERGYLTYCEALGLALQGNREAASSGFASAAQVGGRFGSAELAALARVGHGRCLISDGDVAGGLALLDEAMAAITVDVSPAVVGDVYCTVIEGCQEVFDVRRAQEWTYGLSRWCDAQPELVLYRGQCLVHRAELMLLSGTWARALDELRLARERLTGPRSQPALGSAYYVRGELHRLRGELAEAEAAYRQANRAGRNPQPGHALLLLAQGRVSDAADAIRGAVEAAEGDRVGRTKLLAAWVDIALAVGDLATARRAADELSAAASSWGTSYLQGQAAFACGTVLLAEGNAPGALPELRRAWVCWSDLEAPYEALRARQSIVLALRAAGDEAGSTLELDAVRSELERLAAGELDAGADTGPGIALPGGPTRLTGPTGLTGRETQVLRLVATGVTNRAIAADLVISEKTVATHVSSILRKLDLPSRSAATAYAHRRGLV